MPVDSCAGAASLSHYRDSGNNPPAVPVARRPLNSPAHPAAHSTAPHTAADPRLPATTNRAPPTVRQSNDPTHADLREIDLSNRPRTANKHGGAFILTTLRVIVFLILFPFIVPFVWRAVNEMEQQEAESHGRYIKCSHRHMRR